MAEFRRGRQNRWVRWQSGRAGPLHLLLGTWETPGKGPASTPRHRTGAQSPHDHDGKREGCFPPPVRSENVCGSTGYLAGRVTVPRMGQWSDVLVSVPIVQPLQVALVGAKM
ncbi:hypothetical protein GCM10009564_01050 [Streptomyces thermogriseus]|uniref:Uncharacterized protein n=1 Tax=Streptomyces thermogriseus TaxID=75292 RepID=A0ABP4D7Z1_9ACTN